VRAVKAWRVSRPRERAGSGGLFNEIGPLGLVQGLDFATSGTGAVLVVANYLFFIRPRELTGAHGLRGKFPCDSILLPLALSLCFVPEHGNPSRTGRQKRGLGFICFFSLNLKFSHIVCLNIN